MSSLLGGAFIVEPQGRGKEEHPCCPLGGRKEGRYAEGWGPQGSEPAGSIWAQTRNVSEEVTGSQCSIGEEVDQDPLVRGQDLSLVTWDTGLF